MNGDRSVPATNFDRDTQRCARAMNRMRQHRELCKREGLKIRPAGLRYLYSKIAPSQMVWRRVTSMTIPLEPFMDAAERREGLKRLMGWLERTAAVGSSSGQGMAADNGCQGASGSMLAPCSGADESQSKEQRKQPRCSLAPDDGRDDRMVLADWNGELSRWQRVRTDGFSVEAVCAQLGLSRWRLTQLTKEYCNLTATELFDGFKVDQLKKFMLARMKEAAQQLWKNPGDYAQYKAQGYLDCQSAPLGRGESLHEGRRDAGDTAGRMPALRTATLGRRALKQSAFFPTKPQDLFREERWAEKARRTAALIEKMWEEFDFESWALSAGYSSVRRLKRAILNRLGKTFEQLEKCLAGEVIEYYQCAEDRELRNIALREDDCDAIIDARRLYHKSEERPVEPFLDMWSTYEFAAKDWLVRMAGAFG